MHILKAAWAKWKVIAHKIGNFQARVLLSLFYFAILGPFAVGVKMSADPLRIRPGVLPSWLTRTERDDQPLTLARRQ